MSGYVKDHYPHGVCTVCNTIILIYSTLSTVCHKSHEQLLFFFFTHVDEQKRRHCACVVDVLFCCHQHTVFIF